MTNCQKTSGLLGLSTVKERDSYKAAELLYQTHVGSAFEFIWQCRVYLHFKQGTRHHYWLKSSAAFFLSHNSPKYSQLSWRWQQRCGASVRKSEMDIERKARGGILFSAEPQSAAAAHGKIFKSPWRFFQMGDPSKRFLDTRGWWMICHCTY